MERCALVALVLSAALKSVSPLVFVPQVFLSGGIAASLSHTVAVPVDVVKTKQQSEPERYTGGPLGAAVSIIAEEGVGALAGGLGPTLSGYFIQGGLKYGLYDAFKPEVSALLGDSVPPLVALACAG